MVNVEPFVFQMVTAFKERIQMVSKINEVIDALNETLDPEEVRTIVTEMLSDYYNKEEIDEMFDSIDFSPYYTKTEVNAIVDRIDGDVDTVEGSVASLADRMDDAETELDNLGGRMSTAEGDIDNLETSKQNVLTAGEGIQIINDAISLNKGWEQFTPTSPNDLDYSKYDYVGESRDEYFVFEKGNDVADVVYKDTNTWIAYPPCRVFSTGVPSGLTMNTKLRLFTNIDTNVYYKVTKAYLANGTLLDASNIDTYFTDGVPNTIIHFVGKPTSGNVLFSGTLLPGESQTQCTAIDTTGGSVCGFRFFSLYASYIYNSIKSNTNFKPNVANFSLQNIGTSTATTWYRKLV